MSENDKCKITKSLVKLLTCTHLAILLLFPLSLFAGTLSPATGVTLTADMSSPQLQGTSITFTSAATGGSGSYEYYFTLKDSSTGTWSVGQAYSSNPTWVWDTTAITPGTYMIMVWARSVGSTAEYDALAYVVYTINLPPVTDVTLTVDKGSPQLQGAVITFSALATGGTGNYEYYFKLWNPNTYQWSDMRSYSESPVWTWDTTGIASGTYILQVWARSAGSTASFEACKNFDYTINTFTVAASGSPIAEIGGAPSGLTNQANPIISIGGNDVVAYRYKLDTGDYSNELSVSLDIQFSAVVSIFGQEFMAGDKALQNLLDSRTDFIDSIEIRNVAIDSPVIFLLNPKKIFLKTENTLYIEGSNIDQLEVYMNNSPNVPAVIVDQSLQEGAGYITYALTTNDPQTDFIRIINRSTATASFKINLNNMMSASDEDVLNEINAMSPEYTGEPIQRKAWRFVRDNRYHWYPLADNLWYSSWGTSSPSMFFNSIGFGFCYEAALLYCELMSSLGYQARTWGLSGKHSVPEVFIDGRWEMFDPDQQVYYYNEHGNIAGVEELEVNPSYITNPINPLISAYNGPVPGAYSQSIADIYSSSDNYYIPCDHRSAVVLTLQIPSGGTLDFPHVFAAPIHTTSYNEAPSYTNAKLTIPRGWSGTISTPLVIHSIGYEGPHTLSIVAKSSAGNWQAVPSVANWTTDSWAPITTIPLRDDVTLPITLTVNKPATIYYTLDGSTPSSDSPVYTSNLKLPSNSALKFFAVDLAGNRERIKSYDPLTGIVSMVNPAPVMSVSISADNSSPQLQGATVTFTAMASGGTSLNEYYYTLRNPITGQWSGMRSYSVQPTWTWNTTGADPGTYMIMVWSRSLGSTAEYDALAYLYYTINPPPASSVTLSSVPADSQTTGQMVTFSAAASGGSGSYEYQFWLRNPAGTWSSQSYSGNSTWTWNTTGLAAGVYAVQVRARNAGSAAAYEAVVQVNFTLNTPVSSVTLSSDPQTSQTTGQVATFTAAASGGTGSFEYQFWLRNPAGTWSSQSYGSNSTWAWDTTGLAPGLYAVQVRARNAGSTAAYEAVVQINFSLNAPVSSVTLSSVPQSSQVTGQVATFTAAATGGSGNYEYQFWLRNPAGTWSSQSYSGNSTWAWDTTGLAAGVYAVQVRARNTGSAAAYEAIVQINFTLNTPVSSVMLSSAPQSSQTTGQVATFSAAASGGSGNYEYQFWLRNPAGTWSSQSYSGDSTWTWDTTGLAAGVYAVQVRARNTGSAAAYEAVVQINYTLNAQVSSVTLSSDPQSSQTIGQVATFTAAASGGTGSYEYQFWLRNPAGTWSSQYYGSNSTWAWNTTDLPAGVYAVQVRARNAGSTAAYEVISQINFTLNAPVSSVTLSSVPQSSQTIGQIATFAAEASGGTGSYEYQFWLRNPSGTWSPQSYSGNSTWTWDTTGLAAGVYAVQVRARNLGSTVEYEAISQINYSLLM